MTETTILDESAASEIEARANAATEGPWIVVKSNLPDDWGVTEAFAPEAHSIAQMLWEYDAPFVAHAREDIPALCATVRHLRNKTCPDCATVAPDGSGYCHTCDSFTMPSDFSLRWVRRAQLDDLQSQLEQLRAENVSLKKHVEDLNHDLECAIKESNEHGNY